MPKPETHSCGNSGAAACPFYLARNEREIHCEGFFPDSKLISRFRCRTSCNLQHDVFCCEHFECCEVYRMLMAEKYPEEDEK